MGNLGGMTVDSMVLADSPRARARFINQRTKRRSKPSSSNGVDISVQTSTA